MKEKKKVDELWIVLIVAILAIIITFYQQYSGPKHIEAEKIAEIILDGHEMSFARGGTVDEIKLGKFQSMSYEEVKAELGTKSDFCIYIEDEKGNVLLAKGSQNLGRSCR